MSFERSLGPSAARKSHRREPLEVESLPAAEAQAVAEAAANNASLQAPGEADQLVEQSPDSYFAKAWKAVRAFVIADPITDVHVKDRTTQAAERKAALLAQRRQLFQAVARLHSELPPRQWLGKEQFTKSGFEVTIKDHSYRVLSALDRGGQGQTFRVEDVTTQQRFIMKVSSIVDRDTMFFEEKSSSSRKDEGMGVRRMIQEIATLKKLDGTHTTRLIDAQFVPHPDDSNQRVMVEIMEEAHGQDMFKRMEAHPPTRDPDYYIKLSEHIMQALNVIHERGVLHLDIKPEHIFIDDDMAIEFIDFGASYDVARARQQYSSTSDTAPVYALRDNAHRLITEGYALKEQQFVNEAFDIYTLGRSILTFLYGEDIDDVTRFLPLHKRLPEDLQKLGIMARKMTVNTVDARPTLEQSISELHNLFPHIFAQPVEAAKAEAS